MKILQINKTSFNKGDCRALKTLILDLKFKTRASELLTKGTLLKEIQECDKLGVDENLLTIVTSTHLLTVTLEDD